ncbi:enoyl-ACP reductase FabI [Streptomyces sp. NPDC059853]|uniref:enoyl-ACP reductase FabI n=1 Tax=Streptomyces sp. NPDC059853 TaxID=3346973 RepID=UPI00364D4ECA
MTGLLDGKRLLITGVLTDASLAFHVARVAQEQGAEVVLTGFGRLSLVERVARRLPAPAPVIELDVTDPGHLDALAGRVSEHVSGLDGVVHSIGFAPPSCLGGPFLDAPWEDVATTVQVSAYSFMSLTRAVLPLLSARASVVGMDFDARQAWPDYNWMGVAKAGLESVTRYLAKELGPRGIRVNLVAAGPVRTVAATSIPGSGDLEREWGARAPLGWRTDDAGPVGRSVCALLSDWLPATTGSVVWADGGFHAVGA